MGTVRSGSNAVLAAQRTACCKFLIANLKKCYLNTCSTLQTAKIRRINLLWASSWSDRTVQQDAAFQAKPRWLLKLIPAAWLPTTLCSPPSLSLLFPSLVHVTKPKYILKFLLLYSFFFKSWKHFFSLKY